MVSILLPVYNAEPYLSACLDSILTQRMQDWELIAVNDHSTDESLTILERYAQKDQRIQVWKNQAKGIIPALRLAYSKSSGRYITRMDADDLMPAEKLEKLCTSLQEAGPGYLATALVRYFAENGVQDGYRRYEKWLNDTALSGQQYKEIYRECVIPSPCWMIHREDLDRCGAFSSNQYPEDYDLVFRFYKAGIKVKVVPEVLHLWRDHTSRSSRTMEQYAQQAYFDLKVPYFLKLDRKDELELLLWGAGKKGKQIAKMLQAEGVNFRWICDNPAKEGRHIYEVLLENYSVLAGLGPAQVIIVVSNPEEQEKIRRYFSALDQHEFFFFV